MKITRLHWKQGDSEAEWQGSGKGIWAAVKFTISEIKEEHNQFMITSNIKQIPTANAPGLEAAKEKAQSLLNTYALSQAIL